MRQNRFFPSPTVPQGGSVCRRQGVIVTIDGPAGTGKSTMALRLARHFRWHYVDSGAMYRAVALCAAEQGISWTDEPALLQLCAQLTFEFRFSEGELLVLVDGRDVTPAIRSQMVGEGASRVAMFESLRAILVRKQRELGCAGGIVMDGRDIGTVVFPDADVKFYLDATPEVRGRRRWLELQERGERASLLEVVEAIHRRDHEDRTRQASPLRVPEGAHYIDTTNLSVDGVFELMVDKIKFFGVSFRSPDSRPGMRCPQSTECDGQEEDVVCMTDEPKTPQNTSIQDEVGGFGIAGELAADGRTPAELEISEGSPGDDDQVDMEELYRESLEHIQEGEIIKGRIVQIERDSVLVDVGYKSEGLIPLSEFKEGAKDLKVGDEVDVLLESKEDSDGLVVLSKEKANKIKVWDEISHVYDSDGVVDGEIIGRIKGGLMVDIGLKAFLPGSQVDLRPVRNLDKLIGQRFPMKIIKLNRRRGNIVLSRRLLLEKEREKAKQETLANLREGQVVEGVVKNITEYGAFVDLGGIDGLLHITDMSWGRTGHPSELFAVGDKIKVMVLKYDRDNERISLGLKQITPDPWSEVDKKYPEGTQVRGKVVSITDYGAFVELEQGVEGLVHVSQMSWTKRVKHPSKIVNIGDMVEAVVLSVDKEKKRISLGMKQMEPSPWTTADERYPVGTIVEGKVRNLTDFGAFVTLEEGIDGLIHISDLSWSQRVRHPSDILKKGQKVTAKVLSIDKENERLSLGIKQMTPDPWEGVAAKYHAGENVPGRVVKLTNFGAFVELEEGVEGLIHISELSRDRVANPADVVQGEQEVWVKILKVDQEGRKIGLSLKAYFEEGGDASPVEEDV
jgi:small subunit ribosomal protein S1